MKGIYKNKNGLYRASVTFNHQRYTVSGHTEKECADEVIKLKARLLDGSVHREDGIHFGAWFEKWLTTYKADDLKQSTVSTYREVYKTCLEKLSDIPMKNIDDELILKTLNELKARLSYSRVNLAYGILTGMFEQAVISKIINNNPMLAVKMPKEKSCHKPEYKNGGHKGFLTEDEAKLFLRYAEGSTYYDLILFMFKTGLRINEACGLRWQDISFKDRTITVKHTIVYIRGYGRKLDTPKSDNSERIIYMTDTLFSLLKKVRKEQLEFREALGKDWKPDEKLGDGFVFTNNAGQPCWDDNVRNSMCVISKRINADGIEFVRPTCHTARKTFSNVGMMNGVSPEVMASQLGHGSTRITIENYREVQKSERENMMELMDKVM